MGKKNKTHIIDKGQVFDHFLSKLNLHDGVIGRLVFINQILFIDLGFECIEFHGVFGEIKVEEYGDVGWNYHEIKTLDNSRVRVKLDLDGKILEFICRDMRVFCSGSNHYFNIGL